MRSPRNSEQICTPGGMPDFAVLTSPTRHSAESLLAEGGNGNVPRAAFSAVTTVKSGGAGLLEIGWKWKPALCPWRGHPGGVRKPYPRNSRKQNSPESRPEHERLEPQTRRFQAFPFPLFPRRPLRALVSGPLGTAGWGGLGRHKPTRKAGAPAKG